MEWQWDGMQCQWNRMERNGMEWHEIVCSKSMQDPPKKEPGAFKIWMWKPGDSRQTWCDSAWSWQILSFFWHFSSTNMGEIAGGLEERLRGNMPKKLRKFRKIVPRASKIEPWGLQNWTWSRPRHYFYKTYHLRRLKRACPEVLGSQNRQLGFILEAQDPPKSTPKPQKIDVENRHVFGIDFWRVRTSF